MTDWGTILLYGYLGWIVFADAWTLIIAISYTVGGRTDLLPKFWWFYTRRLIAVVTGMIAAMLYRDGTLDWMWAFLLAVAVSIPEMCYRMWKDITQGAKTSSEAQ